ncbi:MAG TPA: hypothetical protein VMM16_04460 [Verrucomicrobiae bacterium]|nr:hypothetical protein [Verrucomicrobiae bacterium]
MEPRELETRILRLQRNYNRLLVLQTVLAAAVIGAYLSSIQPMHASSTSDVLRIRELVIVDENGIERVIVGAPLPGQWENGKVNTRRVERPFKQAGLLIFDKEGIERGGYVTEDTHDNALLTLDDKKRQEVLLVTGAEPTSSFRMWTAKDSLELRVDPDLNGPTLKMIRDGKTVLEQPHSTSLSVR